MPEHLRSIVNRIRQFVGDRRHAPRYRARLPCTVSLMEQENRSAHASTHARTLVGHTHDLSATGLALVLPAIRIGQRYLMGEGRSILVVLELPAGKIRLRATPVRYERLDTETQSESGYLIGAHIGEMSDEDRALFIEYLKKLRAG